MAVLNVVVHLETVKKKFTSFLMAMNVATLTSALPISIVVLVNHVLIENQAIQATVLTDLVAFDVDEFTFCAYTYLLGTLCDDQYATHYCRCSSSHCPQPTGTCPDGQEKVDDHCVDTDECTNTTVCGFQSCTNTEGSYTCDCEP